MSSPQPGRLNEPRPNGNGRQAATLSNRRVSIVTDRREFIGSGIALTAIALTGAEPALARASNAGTLKLERFVFDSRFAAAASASRAAAATGIALAGMSGDVTGIWYDDFDLKWKKAPMTLAGVTTPQSLFVLETLAADCRMRVVYRGEHSAARDGLMRHSLVGPADVLARIVRDDADAAWETRVAEALQHCPPGRPAATRVELDGAAADSADRDDTLMSWIIAPR